MPQMPPQQPVNPLTNPPGSMPAAVMPEQQMQKPQPKKKIWLVLVVVVVLFLALGGAYWFMLQSRKAGAPVQSPLPSVTQAAAGALVENFPGNYILENNVAVKESVLLNYNAAAQKLYTASYISKLGIDAAFAIYKKYFSNYIGGGWKITNSSDVPTQKFLYAQQTDEPKDQMTVVIEKTTDGALVSLSVLRK